MKYYIQTYTGRIIDFENIKPEDIDIVDAAHSLAGQCRYLSHCVRHYSIAQHNVLVSQYLQYIGEPPIVQFEGLNHDLAEYITGDINGPLKLLIRSQTDAFDKVEEMAETAISTRFNIQLVPMKDVIHLADMVVLRLEKLSFSMNTKDWEVLKGVPEWQNSTKIVPLEAKEAKMFFLERWFQLYERVKLG